MLSILVLLCISTITTQSSIDAKRATTCVLPPQPKNGRYEVIDPETPKLSPGEQANSYSVEVTCNPGFKRNKGPVSICTDGVIILPLTECLHECRVNEEVISCGARGDDQEPRCLLSNYEIEPFDFNSRNVPVATATEEGLSNQNCGSTGSEYVKIIAGGRSAEKQELPWHAGIYIKTTRPYKQICGGSLVSPTVVISAAHCFWSELDKQQPAANYAVAVGKLYRPWNNPNDKNVQKSDVAEIKIPPRYQGSVTNLQDDIALVITASAFTYSDSVTPVCLDFDIKLDEKQLSPGMLGKVAGWGLTGDNSGESPTLQTAELSVVNITECIEQSEPSFRPYITSDKICAGYKNGTSVCKGDSGGGLSFKEIIHGVSRYFLRGVVSAAPRNENLCNTIAWGTFTHVQKHEHFIRQTVRAK